MPQYSYQIQGLHCPSCVLAIEDRLKKEQGIKSVDVDLKTQQITLESKKIISPKTLNQIFKTNHYKFFEVTQKEDNTLVLTNESLWWLWAIFIIGFFLILTKLGLAGFLNINNDSSLIAFFMFGLIAGFSSCGALLSGLILSAPKNTKIILLGRIISYSILGGVLGILGQRFSISPIFTSILVVLVSLVMLVIAFQMLEFKFARQINLFLPKSFGPKIINHNFPFVVGLLTVFLPCGFTLLTEGVAVLSGSFIRGLLIMLVFVLGTSIPLFLVGLSSDRLIKNQKLIGVLILFFVLYNLNFNFGITQKIFNREPQEITTNSEAQVFTATYSTATDIVPNSFTFKVGQPVRLEITVNDDGSGCMSTIMIPGLYQKPQSLIKGKILIMEFTPNQVGTYQITCAMGVPRGTINVIK